MPTNNENQPIQPYLFFDGRCEEAIEFYQKTLGAKVEFLMRFKESPEPAGIPPGAGEKVMHASLRIADSQVFASDGQCTGKPNFQGFALSLTAPDVAQADRYFAGLAEGGKVQMPMAKTFFAQRFGMVADKFGVFWMVIVQP